MNKDGDGRSGDAIHKQSNQGGGKLKLDNEEWMKDHSSRSKAFSISIQHHMSRNLFF